MVACDCSASVSVAVHKWDSARCKISMRLCLLTIHGNCKAFRHMFPCTSICVECSGYSRGKAGNSAALCRVLVATAAVALCLLSHRVIVRRLLWLSLPAIVRMAMQHRNWISSKPCTSLNLISNRNESLQAIAANSAQNAKVREAHVSGLKVVVDCGIEVVQDRLMRSLVKQIQYCLNFNKKAAKPVALHITHYTGEAAQ